MPLNPRTPVLVGYGQINHREEANGQENTPEPVDLMAAAAREAADPRVLEAVDSVRVVNLLSARYRDPGLLLGQRIGAHSPATRYSGIGGNVPQTLVNRACVDIQQGRADVVVVAGAEMWRTRMQLRANGQRLSYTEQDESVPLPEGSDENVPMAGAAEDRIGLDRPSFIYPMFEQALRISRRGSRATTIASASASCGRGSTTWQCAIRTPGSANPSPPRRSGNRARTNRMVSWPYTKLMNSNNMVDQSAALILTSVEACEPAGDPHRTLGVPIRRHRRARHLRDQRARRAASLAGDPDRRRTRAGVGRPGHRRRGLRRPVLVLSLRRSGRRGRTRAGRWTIRPVR